MTRSSQDSVPGMQTDDAEPAKDWEIVTNSLELQFEMKVADLSKQVSELREDMQYFQSGSPRQKQAYTSRSRGLRQSTSVGRLPSILRPQRTKVYPLAVVVPAGDPQATAVILLQSLGFALRTVLLLSGVGTFSTRIRGDAYWYVSIVSAFICLLMCAVNIVDGSAPFGGSEGTSERQHWLLSLVTTWSHVLGLHSFYVLHALLRSTSFRELASELLVCETHDLPRGNREKTKSWTKASLKIFGLCAFIVQVPGTLYAQAALGVPAVMWAINSTDQAALHRVFAVLHGVLIIVTLFPLIALIFGPPLFFAMLALMHYADVKLAISKIEDEHFAPDANGCLEVKTSSSVAALQELAAWEQHDCVIRSVCQLPMDAQRRLTENCDQIACLTLHAATFACTEVITVVVFFLDVRETGFDNFLDKYLVSGEYLWYWTAICALHALYATMLFVTLLSVPGFVTQQFVKLSKQVTRNLVTRGIPVLTLADTGLVRFLEDTLEGWTLLGRPVTTATAYATFVFLVSVGCVVTSLSSS